MQLDKIAYPQWTEYAKKSGLDPLGMQNSSIDLYQRLLPGISNVTLRIRYYGLYAWLASLYAQYEGRTDAKSWQRFVRRAEALYALTVQQGPIEETGVAGIQWARRHLDASVRKPAIDFSANAEPGAVPPVAYLKQAYGAYGAAYGGQLFELGILANAADHEIPVPSTELGDGLAQAFGNATAGAARRFHDVINRAVVTPDDLRAFAPLVPSEISPDGAERQLYEDLLFAKSALQRPEDLARRDTLLLILNAAAHFKTKPDVGLVRWLLYAGFDEEGRSFAISDPRLEQPRQRWWVYHANDLLHYSYENLLKFILDTLAPTSAGMTLRSLIAECVSRISEVPPAWPLSWKTFVKETTPTENPSAEDAGSDLSLFLAAREGARETEASTPESAWAALKLLAVVEQRSSTKIDGVQEELGHLDREGFHSLVTELEFLKRIEDDSFTTALSRILDERIVKRHLWVAHRKFRYQGDYTFLFEVDEGLVRFRAPSGPVLTNPRLGPAITFLEDLSLIDTDGLTEMGWRLLDAP